ncbi:MAG: hypothetical protein DHS80DRAFT_7866, partial [Piptocephalis tieghemiana]
LPFRVRWQNLKDLFRQAGNVLRADVAMGFDHKSKGYGTVLFSSMEEAKRAIDMFQHYVWLGRTLEVREDRGFVDKAPPSAHPPPHAMGHLHGHGGPPHPHPHHHHGPRFHQSTHPYGLTGTERQIFVGNLPFDVQWPVLKDLFRTIGHVIRADIAMDPEGKSRGYGTVLFATAQEARQAIDTLDGHLLHGRSLHVRMDK